MQNSKKGVSLVVVLLFMLVATIAATATYRWLTAQSKASASRMVQSEAYQSAVAGIEAARSWMTFHGNDLGGIIKQYFDDAKFKQLRYIEWIKTNPVPLNSKTNYLTNSREIALVGVKGGKPTFHSEYDNGIYSYPICHDKGRFHPTQKPLALIEDLIVKHSDEGDIICDCFSGSGTTAVASYNTNRNFVGCELSKEYYDKSLLRFEELGFDGRSDTDE